MAVPPPPSTAIVRATQRCVASPVSVYDAQRGYKQSGDSYARHRASQPSSRDPAPPPTPPAAAPPPPAPAPAPPSAKSTTAAPSRPSNMRSAVAPGEALRCDGALRSTLTRSLRAVTRPTQVRPQQQRLIITAAKGFQLLEWYGPVRRFLSSHTRQGSPPSAPSGWARAPSRGATQKGFQG